MTDADEKQQQLEMLVTEHERVLEQYSDLFQDQQAQLDQLKRKLRLLEEKIPDDDGPDSAPVADEPPPHY